MRRLLLRNSLSLVGFSILIGAALFVPAGLTWRNAWIFLIVFLALMIASMIYLWRVNPDIFVARSRIHQGTKSWDKLVLALVLPAFFGVFVVAGLDARFAWSAVPPWMVLAGYVLLIVGFIASDWVYAVNRFAEPSVRIQKDRGQTVIDTGPYWIVRHPLYVAGGLLMIGIALALSSFMALILVGIGCIVLVIRTVFEDRMLQLELEGYRDYALRVRYRLIPGVW